MSSCQIRGKKSRSCLIIIVKKIKIIVFFFTMILLAYSCGQKGPLMMPEKKYPVPNIDIKEQKENGTAQ